MKYKTPLSIYGDLFLAMSSSGLWPDDKVIADLEPKFDPEKIIRDYSIAKDQDNFDLQKFVNEHFTYQSAITTFTTDKHKDVVSHINELWHHLKRAADEEVPGSTLIPLPYPYIVPGGRFNEIYYWDSYFTMLGLKVSNHIDVIENMVNNFAYFIDNLGHIPNGNRTYFVSRSQPPFFSMMVQLLSSAKGNDAYIKYLPQLEKEHHFWMDGNDKLSILAPTHRRVVLAKNGNILNRYFDDDPSPRAEMFATDIEDAERFTGPKEVYYLNVKAACESGWDFSSRWFKNGNDLKTICTTEILPVDLNCLLFNLESVIAHAYKLLKNSTQEEIWNNKACKRKDAINQLFWSDEEGFYMDYNIEEKKNTSVPSLAGLFPLFLSLADKNQAEKVMQKIEKEFLKDGGLVTTLNHTGQQWDAPNGWAPLQYVGYKACVNYGGIDLAKKISNRWSMHCNKVYQTTGKMMEKYNVENIDLPSGGGEYPVQDGFGWSNGVMLYFLSRQS